MSSEDAEPLKLSNEDENRFKEIEEDVMFNGSESN